MATWRSASIVAATLQGRTGRRLSRSPNATSRHRRRLPKDRWIGGGSGLLADLGGPGRVRTVDLFHAMEARSQLRHRPTFAADRHTPERENSTLAGTRF